jgi:hypothetical protein
MPHSDNPKPINPKQSSNTSMPKQDRPDNFEAKASQMKGVHPNTLVSKES